MQTRMSTVLPMLLLTGCVTEISETVCPSLFPYSIEAQVRAAYELEALPDGSEIARLVGDYAAVRAEIRACRA